MPGRFLGAGAENRNKLRIPLGTLCKCGSSVLDFNLSVREAGIEQYCGVDTTGAHTDIREYDVGVLSAPVRSEIGQDAFSSPQIRIYS